MNAYTAILIALAVAAAAAPVKPSAAPAKPAVVTAKEIKSRADRAAWAARRTKKRADMKVTLDAVRARQARIEANIAKYEAFEAKETARRAAAKKASR